MSTDFYDKEIPKVGSNYNYLAVIFIVFILKKKKSIIHLLFKKNMCSLCFKKSVHNKFIIGLHHLYISYILFIHHLYFIG